MRALMARQAARLITNPPIALTFPFTSSFYQIAKNVICRRRGESGGGGGGSSSSNHSSPARQHQNQHNLLRRGNSFHLDDDQRFMTRTRLRPGGPSSRVPSSGGYSFSPPNPVEPPGGGGYGFNTPQPVLKRQGRNKLNLRT
jgi:hypothetical protein